VIRGAAAGAIAAGASPDGGAGNTWEGRPLTGSSAVCKVHRSRPAADSGMEVTTMPSVTAASCVRVDVPLDLAGVGSIRSALRAACARADSEVVLDLSECDFVDVVGYRLLREAVRCAERRHLRVRVEGAGPRLVRLISLLDRALHGDVHAHLSPT
jgi:anti-anti-sigma factor